MEQCPTIYDIRDPSRPRNSDQSKPDSTNQTGSAQVPADRRTTTLPSRYRDTRAVDPELGSAGNNAQQFHPLPRASAINSDAIGQGGIVDMDMDFSPDFGGLGGNPPSDHPTPSTLNSSSNTSYSMSGLDNPSPGKKQQSSASTQQSQSSAFDNIHSVHISPVSTESPAMPDLGSFAGNMYSNRSNTSLGDTNSARAYPDTPGWDMSATNPSLSNVDLSSLNVDALSEAQWAQILENNGSGPGWENWRPS